MLLSKFKRNQLTPMKKLLLYTLITASAVTANAQINAPSYAWFADGGLCFRVISEEDGTAGLAMPCNTLESPDAIADADNHLNSLTELTVPSTATDAATGKDYRVTEIFSGPLDGRPNLRKITVSEGVTSITGIIGCSALAEVNLPQSLVSLSGMQSLPSLESIELPSGLKVIGDQSFIETGLKSLTIPSGVEIIPLLSIRDNDNLEELDLSNVKMFLQGSVCNSDNIKRLVLPDSPFDTDYYTFSLSGLEELWIGSRLTSNEASICSQAFSGLTSLSRIYIARTEPPVITEQNPMYHPLCFDGTSNWNNITLYVPAGYKDAYCAAYCWQNMNIVEHNFESSLSEVNRSGANIAAVPGGIRVEAEGTHSVAVYSASGSMLHSSAASQGDVLPLDGGLYIVVCNGSAAKIMVK